MHSIGVIYHLIQSLTNNKSIIKNPTRIIISYLIAEVNGENRVFFRLPFGGVYSDPDRDKQRIKYALANLVNIKNLWGSLGFLLFCLFHYSSIQSSPFILLLQYNYSYIFNNDFFNGNVRI